MFVAKERGDAIEITLKNVYLGPGLAPGEIYHMQPHAASSRPFAVFIQLV